MKFRAVKKRELVFGSVTLRVPFLVLGCSWCPFRSNTCDEQFDVCPRGKGENPLSASEHKGMLCLLPASGQSVISFQSAYFYPVLLSKSALLNSEAEKVMT